MAPLQSQPPTVHSIINKVILIAAVVAMAAVPGEATFGKCFSDTNCKKYTQDVYSYGTITVACKSLIPSSGATIYATQGCWGASVPVAAGACGAMPDGASIQCAQ